MTARHREYHVGPANVGTLWVYIGPVTHTRVKSDLIDGWSDDVVGHPTQDNGLTIRKVFTRVHIIDGEEWYTNAQGVRTLLAKYTACPTNWAPTPKSGVSKWADPTTSDLLTLATSAVARCNPSAPTVSLPTAIAELKDIPGSIMEPLRGFQKLRNIVPTVRNFGLALLRGVATGHIAWRWVIKPMMRDIEKLCQFTEATEARARLIRKLSTSKSVRTRCSLGTVTSSLREQVTVESQRATLISYRDTYYEKSEWATVRWRMNEVSSRYWKEHNGYEPIMTQARKLVLGATSYEALATAWELLPWSWLADWFGNIGDTIAACNNSLGCYPVSACFMRSIWTKSTYTPKTQSSWIRVSNDPQEQEVTKRRFLLPLTGYYIPSFALPILTEKQLTILGSLAALKGTRPFKSG